MTKSKLRVTTRSRARNLARMVTRLAQGQGQYLPFVFAFVFLLLGTGHLCGQRGWGRTQQYYDSNVQVAGSRVAQELLTKAEKDLESGEFDRCVRLVQRVLDHHASGALSTENGRFVGIRDYCNEFIAKLPPKGQITYRRIFDPYAKEIFERGLTEHNPKTLGEVFRRYQYSSFGAKALLAALDLEFNTGAFQVAYDLASLYFELFSNEGQKPERHRSDRRAAASGLIAARMMNDRGRLERFSLRIPPAIMATEIAVAGNSVRISEFAEQQRMALIGANSASVTPKINQLLRARWNATIRTDNWGARKPSHLYDFKRNARPQDFAWNPVLPVMDEGAIYFSDGVSIRAFSLFNPELKWQYDGVVKQSQARVNLTSSYPITLDRNILFAALEIAVERETRIWNFTPQLAVPDRRLHAVDASRGNSIWSQMEYRHPEASDQERFFVRHLSITSRPLVIGDNLYCSATRFHTSYHHYVCCFDRNNGRLKWSVFVCTGQMEQNMFGNRVRECVSGDLVEKDGILYYSTNIGVIAAIDSRLRTLKFTAAYKQVGIPRQDRSNRQVSERAPTWANNTPVVVGDTIFFTPIDSQELLAVNRHTGHCRVVLKRDRSSHYRYIAGPFDGKIAILGAKVAFYDTVKKELLLASGINFAASSSDLAARQAGVSGQPVIVGNRLFAPVHTGNRRSKEGRIYAWDLTTLKIDKEVKLRSSKLIAGVGNLSFHNGVFVMTSTASDRKSSVVRCYFDRAELQKRLFELMARHPEDPRPHFQAGEIALQEKEPDFASAIASFRKAERLAGLSTGRFDTWVAKSRDELFRIYLDLAENSAHRKSELKLDSKQCFEAALRMARFDQQRVDILFKLLGKAASSRDASSFERHYRTVMSRYANAPFDHRDELQADLPELGTFTRHDQAGLVATLYAAKFRTRIGDAEGAVAAYQRILRDYSRSNLGRDGAWTAAYRGIDRILSNRNRVVYAKQELAAKQLFDSAGEHAVTPLRRLLDLYPNSQLVTGTYVTLARRLTAAGYREEAVQSIEEYLSRFRKPSGKILVALARAYSELGLKRSSRQVWSYAASVTPRDLIETGDQTEVVSELAKIAIAELTAKSVRAMPKSLGLKPREAWRLGSNGDADVWSVIQPFGERPEKFRSRFFAFKSGLLQCFDADSDQAIWKISVKNDPQDRLQWFDGRLLAVLDGALVAINPENGQEYWRAENHSGRYGEVAASQGKVYSIITPLAYNARYVLQARSLITGDVVFERGFTGAAGSSLTAGDRWILVNDDRVDRCFVLDGYTGEPAPAWPDGFRHAGLVRPSLNANGLIIAITVSTDRSRKISALDPQTGEAKWSRNLGAGDARVLYDDESRLVYRRTNRATKTTHLVAIDTLRATTLVDRQMSSEFRIGPGCQIDGSDLFLKVTQVVLRPRRMRRHFIESFSLDGGESRWRTASFGQGARPMAFPFDKGVLVLVTERVFKSGRNRQQTKGTLHFVDRDTGRVESSIQFENEPKRYLQSLISIVDGALIVADGPLLKVLKP